MVRHRSLFIVAFAAAALLFCGPAGSAESPRTLEITDMAGRKVSVPSDPARVVAVAPGTARLIVYMGLHERLVGIEKLEKKHPRGRPYWLAKKKSLSALPVIGP
ncbi:MAG TPA: iron ABC transporter substrate-binding protein, partial [bacterium]|nr:iron ABC transporter substrate-binding protein [bacterium]